MSAVGEPEGGAATGDFLHRNAMLEVAQAGAAIFFFNRDAVKPQFAKLRPEMAGKLVGPIDFGGNRGDFSAGKRSDAIADLLRGFAQAQIEHRILVRQHGWSPKPS